MYPIKGQGARTKTRSEQRLVERILIVEGVNNHGIGSHPRQVLGCASAVVSQRLELNGSAITYQGNEAGLTARDSAIYQGYIKSNGLELVGLRSEERRVGKERR